ncbi:MAG: FKBP-type peptidyl-prolyl cis-trans isomerase [Pirellulaceae bacterium]|jgi:FKBP-type peptidyl-prolyl cis-trans isomerase FklB|nr:FKBP-type peptidyl-prolyl cis-trans isomerase [Pirellulaceae bacterium]MDP6556356.1 FKBP-type peptidyl-prolyl cis-trans isomerase [Pirellulaceae bacterium]
MIRIFAFGLFLASANLVMAQAPAEKAELDLTTTRLKASYAIGLSIGKSLKADGLEVDITTLAAGLRASLEGKEAKLNATQIREAIGSFQQEMQAKVVARKKVQGEKNKADGKAFLAKNGKKDGVITLASGLQYQVLKKGNGKRPTKADRVKTHYHGTLLDGTVFDSSVERKEPISFGVTGVIAGWTEALQLMQVGDKWRLFVPSDLAYAERGAGADIGPHATLIFEVELLGIE